MSSRLNINRYIPDSSLLKKYPNLGPVEISRKKEFENNLPGANYVLLYSHEAKKLIIVPPHHPLNSESKENPGTDYAHVVFEGLSLEYKSEKEGNLILWKPRLMRLRRSTKHHGFQTPVSLSQLAQGIEDLVAVLGPAVLLGDGDKPSRAYIRPVVKRGFGRYGVLPSFIGKVDMTALIWNWPFYLPEEDYREGAPVVVYMDVQRAGKIYAKEAGNYARGTEIGIRSNEIGAHEVICVAPFLRNPSTGELRYEDTLVTSLNLKKLAHSVIFADGMGEEILGVKGKRLFRPPLSVNRLGGTTLEYVAGHMARKYGLEVVEDVFGLDDFTNGKLESLLMLGNAVKVIPVRELVLADKNNKIIERIELTINETARFLVDRFQQELSGEVDPSHPSLLTPVKFNPHARAVLDNVYKNWI